jgi:hypothetical protein
MKKINVSECTQNSEFEAILTDRKHPKGWKPITDENQKAIFENTTKIVYLGNCDHDGDMFAVYTKDGYIEIFKGEINQ